MLKTTRKQDLWQLLSSGPFECTVRAGVKQHKGGEQQQVVKGEAEAVES